MASFDFIEASVKGYEFVWRERAYLARAGFAVVFVKVACLLSVIVLGIQEQFLRQGLVMLPGYAVEGIFIAGLIRYVLYGENIFIWGKAFPAPKADRHILPYVGSMSRRQCIHVGALLYILIKVCELAFTGSVMDYAVMLDSSLEHKSEAAPTVASAFLVLLILWAVVWSFRLFWLYIPGAMGLSVLGFLKRIAGLNSSIYMIATWLMCFLPVLMLFLLGLNLIELLFAGGGAPYVLFNALFRAVFDVFAICLQAVAMTYGFNEILSRAPTKK